MEHSTYEYYFSEFIKRVSNKHDIDPEILISYLNDITPKPMNINLDEIDKESCKSVASTVKKSEYCTYMYSRGEMAGKICGTKLRTDSRKYCCKHKMYETRDEVRKSAILPVGKRSKNDDDKDYDSDTKSVKSTDTKNIILRLNRDIKKMWHPSTGLVFNDEYKVYGYYDRENKEIEELNDKYIDICKKYNFKYIKSE